jgi:FMN phosphatase YigB (HAD superfamily)
MIKNLIYDFAGTLAYLQPSKESILYNYLKKNNCRLEKKKIIEAYYKIDNDLFFSSIKINNKNKKKLFYERYNRKLFKLLNLRNLQLSDNYYTYFVNLNKVWKIESRVKKFLLKKKRKFNLYMISNFDNSLINILKDNKIFNLFNHLAISKKYKLEKPNTKFFLEFFKRTNTNINESVYFGDNYFLDFVPAKKIKLKVFMVDKNNLLKKKVRKIKNIYDYK